MDSVAVAIETVIARDAIDIRSECIFNAFLAVEETAWGIL
jgi:hypothetical protein